MGLPTTLFVGGTLAVAVATQRGVGSEPVPMSPRPRSVIWTNFIGVNRSVIDQPAQQAAPFSWHLVPAEFGESRKELVPGQDREAGCVMNDRYEHMFSVDTQDGDSSIFRIPSQACACVPAPGETHRPPARAGPRIAPRISRVHVVKVARCCSRAGQEASSPSRTRGGRDPRVREDRVIDQWYKTFRGTTRSIDLATGGPDHAPAEPFLELGVGHRLGVVAQALS